jgi:hypothetical protein
MNITSALTQINWLSVIVSALAAFAIGGLWYSLLFVKPWKELVKVSGSDSKPGSMATIFGTTFLLNLLSALVLDMFIGPEATLRSGLAAGLVISVVWISSSFAINYLYTSKPFKLFLIDAGYYITFYSVMGIILGAW